MFCVGLLSKSNLCLILNVETTATTEIILQKTIFFLILNTSLRGLQTVIYRHSKDDGSRSKHVVKLKNVVLFMRISALSLCIYFGDGLVSHQ